MKRSIGICMAGMLLICMGWAQALNNVLTPAETKAGFKLLFDGASSSQWTINWPIDDSAMKSPGTGNMIYSKESFTDFEWKVDFKVNANGNSGFFIRTKTDWYCDGFEVAVLDSKDGGDGNQRSDPANGDKLPAGIMDVRTGQPFVAGSDAPVKRSGAIYEIYPTTKDGILIPNGGVYVDMMKPAMVWNSMVIWANGNNIETWLNGVKVTDFVVGSKVFLDRYHNSKFYKSNPKCGEVYPKYPTGTLVMQDHGAGLLVWMRNVKIRSFTPGSKLNSPVVTPEGGTFAGATKVKLDAGITGAAIHYTLDGSDPTQTSPLYSDSTGLMIASSATLKSKAFRANFTASDAASAVFTISGTGINNKLPVVVPEFAMSMQGDRLFITGGSGLPFTADLLTTDGRKLQSHIVNKGLNEISLLDMKSGVYLVSMHTAQWQHSRKIAIP
ncbi:MAG: hypothetical protein JWO30_2005 [Fibrobacteres bacterium]|nr:hypothetical protein [Fibrobacterota bacterium]